MAMIHTQITEDATGCVNTNFGRDWQDNNAENIAPQDANAGNVAFQDANAGNVDNNLAIGGLDFEINNKAPIIADLPIPGQNNQDHTIVIRRTEAGNAPNQVIFEADTTITFRADYPGQELVVNHAHGAGIENIVLGVATQIQSGDVVSQLGEVHNNDDNADNGNVDFNA